MQGIEDGQNPAAWERRLSRAISRDKRDLSLLVLGHDYFLAGWAGVEFFAAVDWAREAKLPWLTWPVDLAVALWMRDAACWVMGVLLMVSVCLG